MVIDVVLGKTPTVIGSSEWGQLFSLNDTCLHKRTKVHTRFVVA